MLQMIRIYHNEITSLISLQRRKSSAVFISILRVPILLFNVLRFYAHVSFM